MPHLNPLITSSNEMGHREPMTINAFASSFALLFFVLFPSSFPFSILLSFFLPPFLSPIFFFFTLFPLVLRSSLSSTSSNAALLHRFKASGHRNVTLPLQFCHPGPPFPTLLRPAGHPQNGLKFWLVGRLDGRSRRSHTNLTLPLQFCHPGPPFPTLYTLRATPKTALNFGRSIGRSQGSHTNVTLPLQFCHPGPPFPTLLRPVGHPLNGLIFWSINRSVTGKSHKCHTASSVLSPGSALPNPCGPPPKRP
jgi:hypothetical protein